MTKQEYIEYLRKQAFWMVTLADQIEHNEEVTCEWCIDVALPGYSVGEHKQVIEGEAAA